MPFATCPVAQLPSSVFSLNSSKLEISKSAFCDIVSTHNDQISHVKHVLDPFCVFFISFGTRKCKCRWVHFHSRTSFELCASPGSSLICQDILPNCLERNWSNSNVESSTSDLLEGIDASGNPSTAAHQRSATLFHALQVCLILPNLPWSFPTLRLPPQPLQAPHSHCRILTAGQCGFPSSGRDILLHVPQKCQ